MKPLSRKTKARLSAIVSPTLLLASVLAVGGLVVLVHLIAVVIIVVGVEVTWMKNATLMGPAVAIVAFAIAAVRRQMAIWGWGAVHEGALPRLLQDMEGTSNAPALQAALATRSQKQGWLSWSCVMDTLSSQGLSPGEYRQLKWKMLCSWGCVHSLDGPVATRACFRTHLRSTAWAHGALEANTSPVTSFTGPALVRRL